MNLSGPCVAKALRELNLPHTSMVVVHDSLDHAPSTLSPKFGGSANGHNGVRSIISALGGKADFHRLRIGIGRGEGSIADFVLSPISSSERAHWGEGGRGIDMVCTTLSQITTKIQGVR